MRDIEFLPNWYIKTTRRKKLLSLQFGCTAVLTVVLGVWSLVNTRQLIQANRLLDQKRADLIESASRVQMRQTLLDLNEKLQNQSKVDASLGLNVESARILKTLDAIMPAQASLTELTVNTDERPVALAMPVATNGRPPVRDLSRELSIKIKGVAPSNEDVAAIYEGLEKLKFCQDLKLAYSTDKIEKDRVMREFLIEFSIPLDVVKGKA